MMRYQSKYYGKEAMFAADAPAVQNAIRGVLYCLVDLKAKSNWTLLIKDMEGVLRNLEALDTPKFHYQVELITDVVVPYLQKLNGRFHTDEARQRQVMEIIYVATLSAVAHPADAFLLLDHLADQIRSKSGIASFYFKSELLTVLEIYLQKKWRPLLWETKAFLQGIGAKLLGVGLIGLIGWPLAVLYPLLLSTKQLTLILRELDQTKHLSVESILQLGKLAVITFASLQLVSVLQAYVYVAYLAVTVAAACFLLSVNNSLMKPLIPAIAPYADLLDSESGFSLRKLADALSGHQALPVQTATVHDASPRVEIIYEGSKSSSTTRGAPTVSKPAVADPAPDENYFPADPVGVRKRKTQ